LYPHLGPHLILISFHWLQESCVGLPDTQSGALELLGKLGFDTTLQCVAEKFKGQVTWQGFSAVIRAAEKWMNSRSTLGEFNVQGAGVKCQSWNDVVCIEVG
jgi:hypothetical protein